LRWRDGLREKRDEGAGSGPRPLGRLPQRERQLHIPGTVIHVTSIDAPISVLVIAPLGFATGQLAGTIAVAGIEMGAVEEMQTTLGRGCRLHIGRNDGNVRILCSIFS
jgi:hypothetical protein